MAGRILVFDAEAGHARQTGWYGVLGQLLTCLEDKTQVEHGWMHRLIITP